jgi:hypothetical protein
MLSSTICHSTQRAAFCAFENNGDGLTRMASEAQGSVGFSTPGPHDRAGSLTATTGMAKNAPSWSVSLRFRLYKSCACGADFLIWKSDMSITVDCRLAVTTCNQLRTCNSFRAVIKNQWSLGRCAGSPKRAPLPRAPVTRQPNMNMEQKITSPKRQANPKGVIENSNRESYGPAAGASRAPRFRT